MNWKKEGFRIDDKVCIVLEVLGRESKVLDATVTYVGTKKMKVVSDARVFEFIGSNRVRGALCGYIYYVYKNSEDYYSFKKNETLKHELCGYITNNIDCMSLEDLEYIKKYIDEKNELK